LWGQVLQRAGRNEKAIKVLKKAVNIDPQRSDALYSLTAYLRPPQGDVDAGILEFLNYELSGHIEISSPVG